MRTVGDLKAELIELGKRAEAEGAGPFQLALLADRMWVLNQFADTDPADNVPSPSGWQIDG